MAFCRNCGVQLVDGASFCSGCGTPTAIGSAPAATAAPVQPVVTTTATAPAAAPAAAPMTSNVAAALSYIPIVAIVFLIIEPYKRDRFVRFHAFQSLFFTVAVIVVSIFLGMMLSALVISGVWSLVFGLFWIFRLAVFIGWLVLVFKAYNNESFKLPVIGDIAEKQAAQM